MGLKDHLDDGIGRILDLGLDLDYLHVESTDRQPDVITPWPPTKDKLVVEVKAGEEGACSTSSSSSSEEEEEEEEENAGSESEAERAHGGASENPRGSVSEHLQLSRSPNLDPGQAQTPPEEPKPTDALREYRTKMEFALKLGYTEELVRLVLGKLGADALINDILGELVKLGNKVEAEQGGASASSSSSLSSSSSMFLADSDSHRSETPPIMEPPDDEDNLRPVVLDGSNVAMSHGNKEVFSCHGIKLAVDWFLERGHKDVTVFVPAWRKEQSRPDALITDQEILRRLEKEKIVVFTPSRRVQGRRVVCYDDRFIVKLAYESDGIIVSNDNYRDLANEKPEWKKFIDERLLMYSFANDKFMPPDDPLGRHGPSLENFLRKRPVIPEHKKQPCPYGKKCTYGHKCKFYHPERGPQPQRSVADELRASAKNSAAKSLRDTGLVKSHSLPSSTRPDVGPERAASKRQSDPSIRTISYSDPEDRLNARAKMEVRKSNNSPAPPPPAPPIHCYPHSQWAPPICALPPPKAHGTTTLVHPEGYLEGELADLSYYSMAKAYSGLSPDRRFPREAELRISSVASDCSSEGSVSSDSYSGGGYSERACVSSPDSLLEDNLKCHHHHHHHHYPHTHPHLPQHPHTSGPLPQHPHTSGTLPQHPHTSGPLPQHPHTSGTLPQHPHTSGTLPQHPHTSGTLPQHPHTSGPLPQHPHTSGPLPQHPHTSGTLPQHPHTSGPLPQHPHTSGPLPQHPHTSGPLPQHPHTSGPLPHHPHVLSQPFVHGSQSLPRAHSFAYEGLSNHHFKPTPPYLPSHLQHTPVGVRSGCPGDYPPLPQTSPHSQTSPLGHALLSTRAASISDSRPYDLSPMRPRKPFSGQERLGIWEAYHHQQQQPAQPCHQPFTFQTWRLPWGHPAYPPAYPAPAPLDPPSLSRYHDVRDKVFVNLCNIFPAEQVRLVMERNPHISDAQQLAAAILAEKSPPPGY